MMGGEDIFCTVLFRHFSEKFVSIVSCGIFYTFFLISREFRDIELLGFTREMLLFTMLYDKLSISIGLGSTERVIKVCDDDFFFRVMFQDEIEEHHTIDSSTHREDEGIFFFYDF
jgi:hypothetical protein